jgi:hypothetical protein
MTKRPPSQIIGQIIDAGEYGPGGETSNPGRLVFVTAEGQHLTPDEAFRRAGASGTSGRKGMADASLATLVAIVIYQEEVGIDVHTSYSLTASRIAAYAIEQNLEGAELLEPEGGTMRDAVRKVVEALKARAGAQTDHKSLRRQ